MEIEEAFTQEAIAAADTNVLGEDEEYLRGLIGRVYTTNEIPAPSEDAMNIAMLCFVAGRTYQSDIAAPLMIEIPMTPDEIHEYLAYLAQKGAS